MKSIACSIGVLLLTTGCIAPVPQQRAEPAVVQPTISEEIGNADEVAAPVSEERQLIGILSLPGLLYMDRNGDGEVDFALSGEAIGSDGYGEIKRDDDYDGFFEHERRDGGFAGETVYDRQIRERVPRFQGLWYYSLTAFQVEGIDEVELLSEGPARYRRHRVRNPFQ